MDDKAIVTCWGLTVLGFIQMGAFYCGVDGTLMLGIVAAVAAAIGVAIPAEKMKDAVVSRVKGTE
jgi:hypothetical protein